MREIKFRAWDTNTKRMIDWQSILCNVGYGKELVSGDYDPLNNDKYLIPMQYTSLKAKGE